MEIQEIRVGARIWWRAVNGYVSGIVEAWDGVEAEVRMDSGKSMFVPKACIRLENPEK